MSFIAVLLLTYKQSLPNYIRDGLFAILVFGFIAIKLLLFVESLDVLAPVEKHICYVVFGGLVDDIHDWIDEYLARQEQQHEDDRISRRSQ